MDGFDPFRYARRLTMNPARHPQADTPTLVIVSPALASANNGNWQTARRWAGMLRGSYNVRLASDWHGGDEALMIALHARRSASSVTAWRADLPPSAVPAIRLGSWG